MKSKVILTLCVVYILGFSTGASAQVRAGSPEDAAFKKIDAESNTDAKIVLLLDFEKQFPRSGVLADMYVMLMELYRQKGDTAKVIETGEKVIALDANNVNALMTVARNLAVEKRELGRAVQYAQRAVDAVEEMKADPAPASYTEEGWQQYIEQMDSAAKSILAYARSMAP